MREIYKKTIQTLAQVVQDSPWEDRDFYENFLAQTYFYVNHSTRLLALGAAHIGINDEKWFNRYVEHIDEERSHEQLALRDLKNLGKNPDQYEELPCTSAFYQSQYFRIQWMDPLSLLGYILALEGISVEKMDEVYQRLLKAHGPNCVSFIKLHANEDISHLEKCFNLIDSIPESRRKNILNNFIYSCELYGSILKECAQEKALLEKTNYSEARLNDISYSVY